MLTFLFRLKGQFLSPQKCNKRGSLFFVYFYLYVQSDAVILSEPSPANNPEITVTTIVTGNDVIWGMELLPNGDLIYGEKKGKIYIKRGEQTIPLEGFPTVKTGGQGGFMD